MKNIGESLRFGEFTVRIEFCSKCSTHSGSLRHDEKKYKNKALKLQEILKLEFPFLTIILQPLEAQNSSRLGCFEVIYRDYTSDSVQLVSSKLNTLKWPETKVVINNIRNYMRPKRLEFHLKVKNLEMLSEKQRNLDSVRCLLISEVDFPTVVQCLKSLQEKVKANQQEQGHHSSIQLSLNNRSRAGSAFSNGVKKEKSVRLVQSGVVSKDNKNLPVRVTNNLASTTPEFRTCNLNNRSARKSKDRVLSSIVVKKLQTGETQADLIKHLLENKPYVFEEGVNSDNQVVFDKVGPGNYRFIVLKDYNFNFGIKEVHVNSTVRPLDERQEEDMEIEVSENGFFELKLTQAKMNPLVKIDFYMQDEDMNKVELEMMMRENLGSNKECLFFRANEVKPGDYKISVEYNDYTKQTVNIHINCGLNKFMLDRSGLTEAEAEGLPKFLNNELLATQMRDMRVDDFFQIAEEKKRYNGEIPRINRIVKKPEKQDNQYSTKSDKENLYKRNTLRKKSRREKMSNSSKDRPKIISGRKKIKLDPKKKKKKKKNIDWTEINLKQMEQTRVSTV